ncbi:hypothetical protein [Streptomyces bambusae]|uniref:Integral membrane protein n=1 Tax=Streptomyces bambusae TaxID=1550616 RepID=A0ABS6YYV4_9ACTN|nr:hypothetical protein [Streptomyces bambusae]MBW5480664.1 hypothetical protein [Streptomyces bambusae]
MEEGWLVRAVRFPVKVVAVLVVLPVRALWELLAACGRFLGRYVLGPLCTYVLVPLLKAVFVWPWVALWRYVVVPVGRFLYRFVVVPLAYVFGPLALAVAWLDQALTLVLIVWPWTVVYRGLLRPVGLAVGWIARMLGRYVLRPLYDYVLAPLGQLLAWAWGVAGRILAWFGRGLRWVAWVVLGLPAVWIYRHVLTPVGHAVRAVWRTVTEPVRQAWSEVRRALFGAPPQEPARSRARTLGSTTAGRRGR